MKLRKYENSRVNMNRLEMNRNKSEYFIIGKERSFLYGFSLFTFYLFIYFIFACANGLNGFWQSMC